MYNSISSITKYTLLINCLTYKEYNEVTGHIEILNKIETKINLITKIKEYIFLLKLFLYLK